MEVRIVRSRDGRLLAATPVEYSGIDIEPVVGDNEQVEVIDVPVQQFTDVAKFLTN